MPQNAEPMVLFFKAHVEAHTRTTKSGKVVQVKPYDTNTDLSSPTDPQERMRALASRGMGHIHPESAAGQGAIGPWGPHNPRIREEKVGKHPTEWGQAPEGASHAVSYNFGKGPVTAWTKRTRHGEMVWDHSHPDGPRWNAKTESLYVARRLDREKHGG